MFSITGKPIFVWLLLVWSAELGRWRCQLSDRRRTVVLEAYLSQFPVGPFGEGRIERCELRGGAMTELLRSLPPPVVRRGPISEVDHVS